MKRSAVGSLLRTTQAFCIQVCEKQTLEFGITYSSEQFPEIAEVQQYREVIAHDPESLNKAIAEANSCFDALGREYQVIALAEGTASEEATTWLEERGFTKHAFAAFALTAWPEISPRDDIRVLPARAMRKALRKTFDLSREAELCDLRLNDPQYDMFVAMMDGVPAGRCALYQVGDIARVMDLHTIPGPDQVEVEQSLLAHVLAMAKRLEMRNVCTSVLSDDVSKVRLFTDAGFSQDGEITEFHRNDRANADHR